MNIETTGEPDNNGHNITDYPNTHSVDTISTNLTLIGIVPNGEGAAYLDETGGNWHFKLVDDELEFCGRHSHTDPRQTRGYVAWVDTAYNNNWRQLSEHTKNELKEPSEWVSLSLNEKDFHSRHTTKTEQLTGDMKIEWEMSVEDAKQLITDLQTQIIEDLQTQVKNNSD